MRQYRPQPHVRPDLAGGVGGVILPDFLTNPSYLVLLREQSPTYIARRKGGVDHLPE